MECKPASVTESDRERLGTHMETIDGQAAFTIAGAQKVIGGSRSSVYRLKAEGKLEVINVEDLGPRVTARSIRRLLGLDGAPEPPAGDDIGSEEEKATPRRGRRKRVGRPQISAAGAREQ